MSLYGSRESLSGSKKCKPLRLYSEPLQLQVDSPVLHGILKSCKVKTMGYVTGPRETLQGSR
jgi:hypothetical protein